MSAELEKRLANMERRLAAIENRFGMGEAPATPAAEPAQEPAPAPAADKGSAGEGISLATTVLGWAGAAALVLAAAYVIRLAIESGWLTPSRQIGLAVLGAAALIGTGLALRRHDRRYAGLLPAGGIVILFLSVYGAHLFYNLIGGGTAAAAVILVCLLSLWLCRLFVSDLYALFAVAGSYSAPFLLPGFRGDLSDLVVYFSSWSIVFGVYSIWVGSRRVYLLALYLALIGFDILWRMGGSGEWLGAVVFQTVHLVIFAVTAALFTLRHNAPMDRPTAFAHLPALLIFYFLQYQLLKDNVPHAAPWVAVASGVFIGACYVIARRFASRELPGGQFLVGAYVALVLFHAGYLESVPDAWAPWVAFILMPAVALYGLWRGNVGVAGPALWWVAALIFAFNYLRVVTDSDLSGVPAQDWLPAVYALQLYAGYYLTRRMNGLHGVHRLLLVAGHISAMAAAVHLLDYRLAVSLAWGLLALACLLLALWRRDRLLGQSSLLIFAASAVKLLWYDLSSATPLIRIGTLVVVGVSFYLGGWLYQRVTALERTAD